MSGDEEKRINAVREYGILDTMAEQVYDDITMLASWVCATPIALISLVDSDRQWFKSKVGLAATELPREYGFCAQAILQPNEVLVVPDALQDPRFAQNPYVIGEPHIRFYAGAPLVTSTGDSLGTVCVIDHVPRQLEAEQIDALRALSRQVVAQMELRRTIAEQEQQAFELNAYQRQLEDYQKLIEKANAELEVQSTTDALTGLMNRRAFNVKLEEESHLIMRHKYPLSLLMIDVDSFKSYNDSFGHPAGDEALRIIAQTLQKKARKCDYVARYGGEEFSVILPHTGQEGAIVIAERLRQAVEKCQLPNRPLTISIGVETSVSGVNIPGLISQADDALYAAKENGRNRVLHAQKITS
jgi:diguanylate cyclase (GGDEF)-like protein